MTRSIARPLCDSWASFTRRCDGCWCCCWPDDDDQCQCRLMLSNRPSNSERPHLDDVSRSLLDRVFGVYASPFRSRRLFADQRCRETSWLEPYTPVVSDWLECWPSHVRDVKTVFFFEWHICLAAHSRVMTQCLSNTRECWTPFCLHWSAQDSNLLVSSFLSSSFPRPLYFLFCLPFLSHPFL